MCYDPSPKPSRAVRFDFVTYYGMSYLTSEVEWPNSDSDCKSGHVCPSHNESARHQKCISCSHKIGNEIETFQLEIFKQYKVVRYFYLNIASESVTAIKSIQNLSSSIEEAGFELCFPSSLIYGLISRLSVEYGKLVHLEGGLTQCRQLRYR